MKAIGDIAAKPPLPSVHAEQGLFRKLRSRLKSLWLGRQSSSAVVHTSLRIPIQAPDNSVGARKRWKVAIGCVAGTRHVSQGRACEDAVGTLLAGDLLGVAIADGAGSAPRGALGATVAVRAALAALEHVHLTGAPVDQHAGTGILRTAFTCALKKMRDQAAELSVPVSDLACTLIVVLSDGSFACAGQVGDGAVVVRCGSSDLFTLSMPINGEFANETDLLATRPIIDLKISSVDGISISDIAVCTDGIQRIALEMPDCTPHSGFFEPLFRGMAALPEREAEEALAKFLLSPRVSARTDDDKTLFVAQQVACST
jgi:hypothetical protein